jgi:hypothetical protein
MPTMTCLIYDFDKKEKKRKVKPFTLPLTRSRNTNFMFGGSSVLKHVQRYDEQKLAKNRKVLLLSIKKRFCYFLKYTFYISILK